MPLQTAKKPTGIAATIVPLPKHEIETTRVAKLPAIRGMPARYNLTNLSPTESEK